MARSNVFALGEFYHVYNRGTDKRIIFNDIHDQNRFVALLYLANSKKSINVWRHFNEGRTFIEIFSIDRDDLLVDIGAYCLMPNHFHILVKEKVEKGISLFMQKLLTGYSMYFNKRNNRTGSLFQGKSRAEHIKDDRHLRYLFSYIHLNPVKLFDSRWKEKYPLDIEKAKDFLLNFRHSSYLDYTNNDRMEKVILSKEAFPEYFLSKMEFDDFISDWLSYAPS